MVQTHDNELEELFPICLFPGLLKFQKVDGGEEGEIFMHGCGKDKAREYSVQLSEFFRGHISEEDRSCLALDLFDIIA